MIPKITRRGFVTGLSALAVTAAAGTLPAAAAVNSNAKQAFAYFKARGYRPVQAAAMVGNLIVDSNVDPRLNRPGAHGIARWNDVRWRNLIMFARRRRQSEWSLSTQLGFILFELDTVASYGKKQLRAAVSVQVATEIFCRSYLGHGEDRMPLRIATAREVLGVPPGYGVPERRFPTLRRGSRGQAVRTVQYLLTAHRYPVTVSGVFDARTELQVRAFQFKNHLKVDGVVGIMTWPKLLITLRRSSSGAAVKGLQEELRDEGFPLRVDGVFGAATFNAVRSFQKTSRISPTGVVDAKTWEELLS